MQHPSKSRFESALIFVVLAAVTLALMPLTGCNGDECPCPVEHTIVITTEGSHCKLTGESGTDVTANVGEWVVWDNQHGSDVQLNFGSSYRLFGVHQAIVYANSTLELRVRNDADAIAHEYNVPCASTHPGPKIVVNPPN